ncbi:hypothetical protein WJX84_011976 [Apatococcus fuscideae]|uniref:Ribosomal RNA small subunit methyltransferase NEP1 n=1 Tax=Apatococcus fuscideae TaxID=2026836 RepID=A0AAW1TG39_9CHLO
MRLTPFRASASRFHADSGCGRCAHARLETAKVGKDFKLLNFYRPDIAHQALLAILDSPLAKAGKLKALYIHTKKNVLIEVNPQVRLPRTFKRFCGLLVQLLQKLSIRATNGPDKLLKVIKGPITKHFPLNAERVGLSHKSADIVTLPQYVKTLSAESVPVFVVGAMAHGKIDITYVDRFMSISQYPLSAAYCIGRITNALEQHWNIV